VLVQLSSSPAFSTRRGDKGKEATLRVLRDQQIEEETLFVDIRLKCSIVIVDIAVNQEYIRVEYLNQRGIIIAELDNTANPVLSREARDPLVN
jgi:hypothetical protein